MERAATPDPSQRRIRVVTLIDYLGRHGGAESLALSVATRLDRERFSSTLCVSRWPPANPEDPSVQHALDELAEADVRFVPLGRRRKLDVWIWLRLVRMLRRERVDVLHAHKFGSNAWGTLVGRLARVPVVLAHEHSWSYVGRPVRRLVDRWLIGALATRFVAVSPEDRQRMTAVEGIPPSRTLLIPNGVPPSPPPSGKDVRAELGIAPQAPILGAVGLLRPEKAYDVLLRAAARLAPGHPQLAVVIAGDGGQRALLERLARELGLEGRVRLLGHRTDVPDLLRAFDVAVCCSEREGSPLSVLEYMDAALPIVASRVGGLPALIDDGVHGLLVPPHDVDALASAIGSLLDDPALARSLGERAHARRRSEFDIDVVVRRIEALYEELLDERTAIGAVPSAVSG